MKWLASIGLAAALALSSDTASSGPQCDPTACEQSTKNCDDCFQCAAFEGYCVQYYQACTSSVECAEFASCQDLGAGWDNPEALYAECISAYPVGAILWAALLDCLACVSCRGCGFYEYDPIPGCD